MSQNEPLFKTSYLGYKIAIYPTHLSYKPLFGLGGEKTIPIDQIAAINIGMPGLAQITIETTGGQKIKLPVNLKHKSKIKELIYQLKSSS